MNDNTVYQDGNPVLSSGQIAWLMLRGAVYGCIVFGVVVGAVYAMWWFGDLFLPRDVEAHLLGTLDQVLRA